MAFTVASTGRIMAILSMHVWKPSIRDVLCSINDHVFVYPDEECFHVEYSGYLLEKNCIKLYGIITLFEITAYAFGFLSPFIGYFLVGELSVYIYPQWVP